MRRITTPSAAAGMLAAFVFTPAPYAAAQLEAESLTRSQRTIRRADRPLQ